MAGESRVRPNRFIFGKVPRCLKLRIRLGELAVIAHFRELDDAAGTVAAVERLEGSCRSGCGVNALRAIRCGGVSGGGGFVEQAGVFESENAHEAPLSGNHTLD